MLLRNSTEVEDRHNIDVRAGRRSRSWSTPTKGRSARSSGTSPPTACAPCPNGGTLRLSARARRDVATAASPCCWSKTKASAFRRKRSIRSSSHSAARSARAPASAWPSSTASSPTTAATSTSGRGRRRHHASASRFPSAPTPACGAAGVMKKHGEQRSGSREPAESSADKPRILIADDEQSMREWMRLLFQRDGFEVLTAEDGIVARDLVAREYVDVVLTDIRMPRLDGVALLQVDSRVGARRHRDDDDGALDAAIRPSGRRRRRAAPRRCSRSRSATSTW